MSGSFTASIFEILVYLIPGIIILLAIYLWRSEQIKNQLSEIKDINSYYLILFLSFAMIFGVVNHQTSKSIQFLQRKMGSLSIQKTTNEFPAKELVKIRLINQLKDSTILDDKDQIYRYCLTYVREKSTGNLIQRIDRLSALSSFSVNLVFPSFFLFLIFISQTYKTNSFWDNLKYLILFLLLEFVLYNASIKYVVAIVYETYRQFLVLTN